jgi:hypothetical protein
MKAPLWDSPGAPARSIFQRFGWRQYRRLAAEYARTPAMPQYRKTALRCLTSSLRRSHTNLPRSEGKVVGLQWPGAPADDRGRRRRPCPHLRYQQFARGNLGALARRHASRLLRRSVPPPPASSLAITAIATMGGLLRTACFGYSSTPFTSPASKPCMRPSKSSTILRHSRHPSLSSFPVSLFDLESVSSPRPTRVGGRRAQGLSRPAVALRWPHAPSFPGRALIDPSTATPSLWSG